MATDKTQSVKFTRSWQSYNAGETATFPPHVAQAMSKAGICKVESSKAPIAKNDPVTPVADTVKK